MRRAKAIKFSQFPPLRAGPVQVLRRSLQRVALQQWRTAAEPLSSPGHLGTSQAPLVQPPLFP